MLYLIQEDLVGNNVFDYIHPKDVAKVKEQLSCSGFGHRDRYINAKSKHIFRYFISCFYQLMYCTTRRHINVSCIL